FDLTAGRLYQTAVLHSRRTRRLAAATGQAQPDVLDVGRPDRHSIRYLHHLVNAAARRIHLHAQLAISGAGVQTEAAMDAAIEIGLLRAIRYESKVCHGLTGVAGRTSASPAASKGNHCRVKATTRASASAAPVRIQPPPSSLSSPPHP